jgi:hypothetical protein
MMKTKILILCAVMSLGFGCKKENSQVDRYKVFSATWEESASTTLPKGEKNFSTIEQKRLVKVDSLTGRVWFWESLQRDTNDQSGWIELTDSGYVLPASLQNKKH